MGMSAEKVYWQLEHCCQGLEVIKDTEMSSSFFLDWVEIEKSKSIINLGYLFLDKVDALPSMEKVAKALDKVTLTMMMQC